MCSSSVTVIGRRTAERIRGAELKLVPGREYNIPIRAIDAIASHIMNFKRRVEKERNEAFATKVTPRCCGSKIQPCIGAAGTRCWNAPIGR